MVMTYITHAHAEYNLGNNKRKGRVTTMQSRPFNVMIQLHATTYYMRCEIKEFVLLQCKIVGQKNWVITLQFQ